MERATQAEQQADGSMRVEYESGAVRFVPPVETNREFEALSRQVARTEFRVTGARDAAGARCGRRM